MYKVLFVTGEAHPFAKTGGLGDVCGSLPPALQRLGHDVRLLLPAYPYAKRAAGANLRAIAQIQLPFAPTPATVLEGTLPGSRVVAWLLDHPPAFDREGHPYIDDAGRPWPDNAQRFALLGYAAAVLAQARAGLDWRPDIVHCHDWQAGLIPALLSLSDTRPAAVFTIHNLAYQGLFPGETFVALGLSRTLWSMHALEFHGQLSFIKGGIVFAERVNTVSPTYAREIQTPAYGYGLDGLLRHRAERVSGILNGIDVAEWDPSCDRYITQPYSAQSLTDKRANKRALQERLGLATDRERPLIGMIGRLVEQKGFDLALAAWPTLAHHDVQMALLGSGERSYEDAWRDLAQRYPGQLAAHIAYDEALAHQIEAGADVFLMPSRFEPCGLNQMYSLRYGTLPIVHNVGGLADTVVDINAETLAAGTANGVVFQDASVTALTNAVQRALRLYADSATWARVLATGMAQDFSWDKSAREYSALYERAVADARAIGVLR
ncbi:MAG: glycogen synthase GlgA [Sulfurifustis sp.]